MTDRDKKTIRIAGVMIAIYLVAFFGLKMWKKGATGSVDYQQLVKRAEKLQEEVRSQENKVLLFEKLTNLYQLDPTKIKKETLVADASAAIQSAAQQGGIQLGPLRESPTRSSGKELTTIQVEGTGQAVAALAYLHKLRTLGYPLIIDSVQIAPPQAGGGGRGPGGPGGGPPPGMMPPGRPGTVKINLSITILNYDQWKEGPNA
jgi:hypothetical protein